MILYLPRGHSVYFILAFNLCHIKYNLIIKPVLYKNSSKEFK